MEFRLTLKMALRSITQHKGRSLLTMLGIIIGIGGIIATNAIGQGAQKRAREEILSWGSRSISIHPGNWASKSEHKEEKFFTQSDLDTIKSQCPEIQYITPYTYANTNIEYGGKVLSIQLNGENAESIFIGEDKLKSGSFYTQQHIENKDHVIVISHETEEAFFQNEDPIGKTVRVSKIPFTIIGVLKKPKMKQRFDVGKLKGTIPFSVAKKYYLEPGQEMHGIGLSTYNEKYNTSVVRQITRILRATRQIKEDESNDFMIYDVQGMAQAAEGGSKIVALFALIAASIALFVGGIGIMNIMLVAVKERTKEIGIKLAIGASPKIIRKQFLIESTVFCIMGGIFGILGGIGLSLLLEKFTELPAIIELFPVIISFLITIAIGMFFGFYPAWKASLLDPVEALSER